MVVFHVTDQHGSKFSEDGVAERIQQVHLQIWPRIYIWFALIILSLDAFAFAFAFALVKR